MLRLSPKSYRNCRSHWQPPVLNIIFCPVSEPPTSHLRKMMGNHMVSWTGSPGNRCWAGELHAGLLAIALVRHPCKEVRTGQSEKPALSTVAAGPQPTLHHALVLGWLFRVVPNWNKGASKALCSWIGGPLTMRHSLGGGITLAKVVSCSQGQVSVRDAAGSCQQLRPQPLRMRELPVRRCSGQGIRAATLHGIAERSVNWKSGEVDFCPGFAKTTCPYTNCFLSVDPGYLNYKIRRLEHNS